MSDLKQLLVDIDLHAKHRGAERLTLGVVFQRYRAAAAEGVMQDEIQRPEIGQFVALDGTVADTREVLLDGIGVRCLTRMG
ncbi:MAG: hypothetical protein RRA94_06135 [Bacteroidota bacterium]|nr:hypothetical protein [Bacteroidota bacterium]